MNIKPALRSDRCAEALIGLKVREFEALVPLFEALYHEERRKRNPDRQTAYGAGRIGHLRTIEEKLFLVLFYLKNYPTYDVLGFFSNLNRSNSYRQVVFLMMVLEKTLGRKLVLPKRQINSVDEFLKLYPEIKDVFLDGTERRTQKPGSLKRRKKLYSGKKKATTRKNVVVSDEKKRVLILTPTKSGRRHDKRLLDKELNLVRSLPPEVTAWTDTGFKGLEKIHPNTQIPKKKEKNRPLTAEEKENNKIIAGIRVVSEHALAGIKRLNCVSQTYRNRLPNLDDSLMLLAAGLWNYHLEFKPEYILAT